MNPPNPRWWRQAHESSPSFASSQALVQHGPAALKPTLRKTQPKMRGTRLARLSLLARIPIEQRDAINEPNLSGLRTWAGPAGIVAQERPVHLLEENVRTTDGYPARTVAYLWMRSLRSRKWSKFRPR